VLLLCIICRVKVIRIPVFFYRNSSPDLRWLGPEVGLNNNKFEAFLDYFIVDVNMAIAAFASSIDVTFWLHCERVRPQ
jgi:hypothetical protein